MAKRTNNDRQNITLKQKIESDELETVAEPLSSGWVYQFLLHLCHLSCWSVKFEFFIANYE
jgi:hypothetical protein